VLTLIKGALDAPETPLGDIEMLSAADRSQLDSFAYGGPINA
jgi:Na+/citrate or Na+/malate symporter